MDALYNVLYKVYICSNLPTPCALSRCAAQINYACAPCSILHTKRSRSYGRVRVLPNSMLYGVDIRQCRHKTSLRLSTVDCACRQGCIHLYQARSRHVCTRRFGVVTRCLRRPRAESVTTAHFSSAIGPVAQNEAPSVPILSGGGGGIFFFWQLGQSFESQGPYILVSFSEQHAVTRPAAAAGDR